MMDALRNAPEREGAVLFLRDPIERLRSFWSWSDKPFPDFEDFIDNRLYDSSHEDSDHWFPQMQMFSPTEIFPFERLAELFPYPIQHLNKSVLRGLPDYGRDRILDFYRCDVEARWQFQ